MRDEVLGIRPRGAGGGVLASLLALVAAAAGTGALAAERPSKGADIKPDVLYHNYCSVCHGDRGDGRSRARTSLVPPPKDFTKATNLTRDYMIAITAEGKPGTAMVGWKTQLSAAETAAVVDYIRKAFMHLDFDPTLQRGQTLYQQTCVGCHGDRGQGTPASAGGKPVKDLTSVQARTELSRDKMVASLAKGHASVPGYTAKLGAPDIEAVVDFVRIAYMNVTSPEAISGTRAHTGRESKPGAAPPSSGKAAEPVKMNMNLPFPNGLTGNAAKGEKFYNDNCATCHGKKGDGQGPRAYFINPKPRNFLEQNARETLNRPRILAAVTWGNLGTEMPAWKFVLTEQEIANVSEYVFRSFIHPQSAKSPVKKSAG